MIAMSDVEVILPNMHGACVTVGNRTHALFRVTNSAARAMAKPAEKALQEEARSQALLPARAWLPNRKMPTGEFSGP